MLGNIDNRATVEFPVNAGGDLASGYELTVATFQPADPVTIGQDVILV